MNGHDLLRNIRRPGEVLLWIEQLDAYLPVMKASLRNTLESLDDTELGALDINAEWEAEDDRLFVITDFGPVNPIERAPF